MLSGIKKKAQTVFSFHHKFYLSSCPGCYPEQRSVVRKGKKYSNFILKENYDAKWGKGNRWRQLLLHTHYTASPTLKEYLLPTCWLKRWTFPSESKMKKKKRENKFQKGFSQCSETKMKQRLKFGFSCSFLLFLPFQWQAKMELPVFVD